jgi:hypothetical protein
MFAFAPRRRWLGRAERAADQLRPVAAGPLNRRAIRSRANAGTGGRSSRPIPRRMPDRVSGGCGLFGPGTRRPWRQRPGGAGWAPRAEGALELRGVQHERALPLVQHLGALPGPGIKEASDPQRQAGGRGDLDRSTERGGDELPQLPAGHRFGGGQVPDLAQRVRSRSQDAQRPGHVGEVVQAVRQVQAAQPAGSSAGGGRAEQPLGHERADPALAGGRQRGQVLGEGPSTGP